MTVKEINEKLFEIEQEFKLFEKKIDDIYFWKLIRIRLFRKVLSHYNLYNIKEKTNNKSIFIRLYQLMLNSYKYSMLNSNKDADMIVFENSRKVKQSCGNYIDPYTHFYIQQYLASENIEIVDEGFEGIHYEAATEIRKFSESIYFDIIYKSFIKFLNIKINNDDKNLLKRIVDKIKLSFNVNIDLEKIVLNELKNFKFQYKKYSNYFNQKSPSKIYIVCSYGKEGLIHAAKRLNIEVIELQHGLIGKYHKGYSYQGRSYIEYFPDKIFLFGRFWYDHSSMPLNENSISVIGYDYFNKTANDYFKNKKIEQTVLIVSQPSLGDVLLYKTIELAKENEHYTFIYRLHPKEIGTFSSDYEALLDSCRDLYNLKFDYCEKNIYQALSKTEYLIGVASTSIFEALAFDIKIILLNIAAIDDMSFLIDNQYVHLFNINDKINISQLRELRKIDISYFFKGLKDDNV